MDDSQTSVIMSHIHGAHARTCIRRTPYPALDSSLASNSEPLPTSATLAILQIGIKFPDTKLVIVHQMRSRCHDGSRWIHSSI
jgi:hypothetical protein